MSGILKYMCLINPSKILVETSVGSKVVQLRNVFHTDLGMDDLFTMKTNHRSASAAFRYTGTSFKNRKCLRCFASEVSDIFLIFSRISS